jgi:predicted GNAT family acetyltransferase
MTKLEIAVEKLAKMKHPSVADILKKRGFGYEAGIVEEIVSAFEESQSKAKTPPNCSNCNGQTEWADGKQTRVNCHFCGLSDYPV